MFRIYLCHYFVVIIIRRYRLYLTIELGVQCKWLHILYGHITLLSNLIDLCQALSLCCILRVKPRLDQSLCLISISLIPYLLMHLLTTQLIACPLKGTARIFTHA